MIDIMLGQKRGPTMAEIGGEGLDYAFYSLILEPGPYRSQFMLLPRYKYEF